MILTVMQLEDVEVTDSVKTAEAVDEVTSS